MRTFLLLLLIASLNSITEASEAPTISNLKENENITVRFCSSGCFHSFTDILEFKGSSVTIYELKQEWSKGKKKYIDIGKKELGTLKLTKDEIKGLDRLFRFYADGPSGGCTTVDTIKLKRFRDNKLVKTSKFVDGSCATYDMTNVITFGALKGRLEGKRAEQKNSPDKK